MSKLNLNPMADWGYVNNSRFRFLSIRNQGGGVKPVPPEPVIPTDRILYTVVEGGTQPISTWITNNCSENHFENGEGYLVLNEGVDTVEGVVGKSAKSIFNDRVDSNVESVILPPQITRIGNIAFVSCSSLTAVTIPDTVTSIGETVFGGCTSLTSITIPNSVESIGVYVFNNCTSLASVTCNWINPNDIPDIIDKGVFNNTSENLVINIPQEANPQDYIDNGWPISGPPPTNRILYTATTQPSSTWITNNCSENVFYENTGKGYLVLNEGVTELATQGEKPTPNIFNDGGGNSITTVAIPSQITRIGDNAFWGCSELTSVMIPNSVTSISGAAFGNCSGLTSITIPDSVTSIGNNAFYGCSGLTSVTIPNSVASIGSNAFYGCTSLTSVTIPNSVTSIGSAAFSGCSGLTSVTIPNSVITIGDSAFANCSGLTGNLTIPNSVTTIGPYAFEGCTSLTAITIPSSVTSIGNNAFNYCTSLASVTCFATTPPTLGNTVFCNIGTSTCSIPEASISAYQGNASWAAAFTTFVAADV